MGLTRGGVAVNAAVTGPCGRALGCEVVGTGDPRIVLRGSESGSEIDPIVNHPEQAADYTHTDGTVWTWPQRWRIVGGVHLRFYDLLPPSA
jgi:hypothetical protein